MRSMKFKFVFVVLLMVGILSACGGQPTQAPASQPTVASAPATEAPATAPAIPTDTVPAQPTADPGSSSSTVSFSKDVLPLLQSRCVNCHGGNETRADLSLNSYEAIMQGSENGSVLIPGDATNSVLADMVVTQKMPKRGPKLTPSETQLIVDWINQGALNN